MTYRTSHDTFAHLRFTSPDRSLSFENNIQSKQEILNTFARYQTILNQLIPEIVDARRALNAIIITKEIIRVTPNILIPHLLVLGRLQRAADDTSSFYDILPNLISSTEESLRSMFRPASTLTQEEENTLKHRHRALQTILNQAKNSLGILKKNYATVQNSLGELYKNFQGKDKLARKYQIINKGSIKGSMLHARLLFSQFAERTYITTPE